LERETDSNISPNQQAGGAGLIFSNTRHKELSCGGKCFFMPVKRGIIQMILKEELLEFFAQDPFWLSSFYANILLTAKSTYISLKSFLYWTFSQFAFFPI
jgi:hypothetical protein